LRLFLLSCYLHVTQEHPLIGDRVLGIL